MALDKRARTGHTYTVKTLPLGHPEPEMSAQENYHSQTEAQALRQEAGRWLKSLREQAGLSQRQLADRVGVEYYTFVSQIESGRGRVPPERYKAWAQAVDVPPATFVRELLRHYDPITFELLFSTEQV
jgi:DNA-binding XRE family transcriptional regulator